MIKVHREVVDTGTTWTEVVAIKCFQKNDLI